MLCRLNHELLPDPGNPIARTTVPLLARTGATAGAAWVATTWSGIVPGAVPGIVWACIPWAGIASAGNCPSSTGAGADASTAEASGASAATAGRGRDRPRPPRVRRRRVVRGTGSAVDAADAAE